MLVNGVFNTPGSEGAAEEAAMPLSAASAPMTSSIAESLPSTSCNDPIGGADNKSHLPPNSEGEMCSGDHSADGSGPYTPRRGDERGKLDFQSPGLTPRQHPIADETPDGLGPGASQAYLVACPSFAVSEQNKATYLDSGDSDVPGTKSGNK